MKTLLCEYALTDKEITHGEYSVQDAMAFTTELILDKKELLIIYFLAVHPFPDRWGLRGGSQDECKISRF